MFRWIFVIFVVVLKTSDGVEFVLDQAKLMSSTYLEGYYNFSEFRVSKFARFSYGLNQKFELFVDFDENIFLQIQIYWRRSNAHEYRQLLHHLKRLPFPDFHQTYFTFVKPMVDGFQNCSNIPPFEYGKRYIWKKVNLFVSIENENKLKTFFIIIRKFC